MDLGIPTEAVLAEMRASDPPVQYLVGTFRTSDGSKRIFIAFLAYCLQVTLQRRLHALAPGLTARVRP